MHLLASLCAGIRGAEDGYAVLTRRGTAALATWYPDFEGATGRTDAVQLDANGGAVAFVNELVSVSVLDADGTVVREFTDGSAAPSVEVRSLSFTGTDYVNGRAAAGKPTTLQAVLDLWKPSAGATDFQVQRAGGPISIASALSGAALYENVKGAPYNAAGDGVTDDYAAIQSALDACSAAGGGTVFFPSGTYIVTASLSLDDNVNLLGAGSGVSILKINHPTLSLAVWSGLGSPVVTSPQLISALAFKAVQANSGTLLNASSATTVVTFTSCDIGDTLTDGDLVTTGVARFYNCAFTPGSATSRAVVGSCDLLFCYVLPPAAYTPTGGCIVGSSLLLFGTNIVTTAVGPYNLVELTGAGAIGTFVGNYLQGGSANVVALAVDFGTLSRVYESGNIFTTQPYSGTAAASDTGLVQLDSRETRKNTTAVIGAGAGYAVPALAYGVHHISITGVSNETITAVVAPAGAHLVVVLDNDAGAGSGTITFGTGFMTLGTFAVANAKIRVFRFVSMAFDGTLVWVKEAADTGDIG